MKKILIVGAAILLLAGCTSRHVLMSDVQWAQDTCERRGGVQYMIQEGFFDFFTVTCNDGIVMRRMRVYGDRQR